jgi:SAM-dependent methyltransferase
LIEKMLNSIRKWRGKNALAKSSSAARLSGRRWAETITPPQDLLDPKEVNASGDLEKFFDSRQTGPGIWKWRHYFPIYERHFKKFRGSEIHFLEIGIYSGGSLDMWREYFGPKAYIYGVDIEPSCKLYEGERTRIFIGDQADHGFWQEFRREVPVLDAVVDDGGHTLPQQVASIDELVPHLRPGGVYLCEDIYGQDNPMAAYATGMIPVLNGGQALASNPDHNER